MIIMNTTDEEILAIIFSFIHPIYKGTLRRVCPKWRRMTKAFDSYPITKTDRPVRLLLEQRNTRLLSQLWKCSLEETETIVNEVYEQYMQLCRIYNKNSSNAIAYAAVETVAVLRDDVNIIKSLPLMTETRNMALAAGSERIIQWFYTAYGPREYIQLEFLALNESPATVGVDMFKHALGLDEEQAFKRAMFAILHVCKPVIAPRGNSACNIESLPSKILHIILRELSDTDVANVRLVSSAWIKFVWVMRYAKTRQVINDAIECKRIELTAYLCSISLKRSEELIILVHKIYRHTSFLNYNASKCHGGFVSDVICHKHKWFSESIIIAGIMLDVPIIYKEFLKKYKIHLRHVNMATVAGNIAALDHFYTNSNVVREVILNFASLCKNNPAAVIECLRGHMMQPINPGLIDLYEGI